MGPEPAERRILITNDRDFGELIARRQLDHRGVIYFRLGEEDVPRKCAWLDLELTEHAGDLECLITVTDHGICMRRRTV